MAALGCAAGAPSEAATQPSAHTFASAAPAAAGARAALAGPVSPGTRAAPTFARNYRVIHALGQGIEFPLPDAANWRHDRRDERSWVARHRATSSALVVRVFRHDRVARAGDCERQARIWRPDLPRPLPSEVLETGARTFADVYAGELTVFVRRAGGAGGGLLGHILAFGSDAQSCLMLAFSTEARGPDAESEVALRLSALVHSVFARAHRLGIGERVQVPRL